MKHCKLKDNINVLPMLKEVVMQWKDFDIDTGRQDTIECQRMTQSINLRKAKKETAVNMPQVHINNNHNTIDTETYERYPKIKEFMNWFESTYGGEIHRIAIVHLPPEGVVDSHIDEGAYYADKDRFHLVLSGYYNNIVMKDPMPESTFIEDDIEMYSAGDLWWFDNKSMHNVENITKNIPRIAIIFDVLGSYFREKI